ncbi:MAG: T9SS type A sorting domain-containing protein, partial [Phaeodactylibacter sp.]|nr:T9SS type A sorting domain-containing protein [Phaeodactylibacter sp.]
PGPLNSELISPSIDCSALETVALSFHQRFYGNWGSDNTFIGVSTDGGQSWEYFNPNLYLLSTKDHQHVRTIDLTEFAARQEDVRLSFRYEGWYYYWLVDDIILSEKPAVDLAIEAPRYPLTSYAQPASLVGGDTMRFSLRLSNKGLSDPIDVVCKATVMDAGGNTIFSDSLFTPAVSFGEEEVSFGLPGYVLPDELGVGNYLVRYEAYSPEGDDFTPVNNTAELPFELTENLFAKDYGEYFGSIRWLPGDFKMGNQYRTGNNWSGGFTATKAITKICCQPNLSGSNVQVSLYQVKPEIEEDWSNFDYESDNSLILRGLGGYDFTDETFRDEVEIPLFDTETLEEGVHLDPGSRYFLMADFLGESNQLSIQISNKIEYPREENSLVFWNGSVWFVFGSGTPSAGSFVPVMRMEVAMDVTGAVEQGLPANALQLSPNPASEFIQIEVKLPESSSCQLTLADAQGRILKMREYEGQPPQNLRWPVDQLSGGMYFLRLSTPDGSCTRKLIVSK